MITVFANIKDVQNPFLREINEVLSDIKNGRNKEKILKIRKTKDKEKRNKLKAELKSICFSGEFSYRSAKNCVKHSGYACLDFDDVENPEKFRDSLKENDYIYCAFVSPSGNGVKAIFKIPEDINNHKKYYEAICETFDTTLDTKTKDISRVCYESFDPDLFINENSKVWQLKKDFTEVTVNNEYPKHFQITDTSEKVKVILAWFNKKFTLQAGERNNNLFKLAAALNKAGMPKNEAIGMFVNFYSAGLKETELSTIVNSAYKNTSDHNTLTLVDDNKIHRAKQLLSKGAPKARRELKKQGLSSDDIEDVIDFEFEDDYLIFWDTEKGSKISLNDYKFKLFLENRGFYKVQLNEKEFTFVKVHNNIITEVNEVNIKDFVLSYVLEINMNVYNFFAKSTSKFTENYLNLLSTKELLMIRDTETESFLFFQNTVLKISKNKVEFIKYIDIGGFIWKKNIIPHDFNLSTDTSDFETFISNVSNHEKERKTAIESSIGYLLNNYKKQDEGLAIIFYDETLNDNPSGRTGKTLISKAISNVRKLVTLNGKDFDNKGQFSYQTINLDDNVVCFDDMERSFKFESLFSIVTGNLTLNKKNLQPIEIPFEESPKILFTSNYILSGVGDSHDARKVEIELHRKYSSKYKPIDEFGKLFFTQWNVNEWDAFFNYMVSNIQLYLTSGIQRIELKTGKIKKLIANTCEDFYEFCEVEFIWDEYKSYTSKDILNSYNDGNREIRKGMNVSWFGKWISMYVEFKGWSKEDSTSRGVRTFTISGIKEVRKNNNQFEF